MLHKISKYFLQCVIIIENKKKTTPETLIAVLEEILKIQA